MFILKCFLILVSFKETIFVLLLNEWDRKLPVNIYTVLCRYHLSILQQNNFLLHF